MDIYLVRHTKVAVSQAICYGASDVALDEAVYDAQFAKIKDCVCSLQNTLFYSSPLNRCGKLAEDLLSFQNEAVALNHSKPIIYDDYLKELNFGDWELMPWNDIPAQELNPWMADFVNVKPPNGENFLELSTRVWDFWNKNIVSNTLLADKVVIVSHGGCIRAFLSNILGLPLRNAYRIHLDYGSVSKIKIQSNHLTVSYINR